MYINHEDLLEFNEVKGKTRIKSLFLLSTFIQNLLKIYFTQCLNLHRYTNHIQGHSLYHLMFECESVATLPIECYG